MIADFAVWRTAWQLCSAGLRDEALLHLVAEIPFTSPTDREVAALGERSSESCIIALDENVLWCRLALPQAQRILRLLRCGRLALRVHAFEPNSPDVLSGARARLLPGDTSSLIGLAIARRQPPEGFKTPHHVRATLKLGPETDAAGLRKAMAGTYAAARTAASAAGDGERGAARDTPGVAFGSRQRLYHTAVTSFGRGRSASRRTNAPSSGELR